MQVQGPKGYVCPECGNDTFEEEEFENGADAIVCCECGCRVD
jgi:DNA-directed RNA polymerase subunit RPC12/RpoP